MNKYLTQFAEARGFSQEANTLYGPVGDVYVTITAAGNVTAFYFSMSCPVTKANDSIRTALRASGLYRNLRVVQKSDSIVVSVQSTAKALRTDAIDSLMATVIDTAKRANVKPNVTCVHCGKETNDISLFNGVVCPVCAECVSDIQELNSSYRTSPLFYLTGIIGALIGSAIGAIPWIIAYWRGWILGILAFVIGLGSFYGYKLFHGPRSRRAALVTVYATSLLTVLGVYVGIAIYALKEYYALVNVSNILLVLSDASTIFEIVIALVLAVLGIIGVNSRVYTYTIPRNARFITRRRSVE
jgi:hypothetical protein